MSTPVNCSCCGVEIIDDGRVLIDMDGGFVVAAGHVAELTRQEALLFFALHAARPNVRSKEQLLTDIYSSRWGGDDEVEIKIIDVFVCKIRKKLAGMPVTIETDWGRGYRLRIEGKRQSA